MLGETLHGIAEYLKRARMAFALFAAGVSLLLLLHFEVIRSDHATEVAIAYASCFGLFVWLGFLVQKAIRWRKMTRRQRALAEEKTRADAAAAVEAERTAAAARARAVDNLRHMMQARTRPWFGSTTRVIDAFEQVSTSMKSPVSCGLAFWRWRISALSSTTAFSSSLITFMPKSRRCWGRQIRARPAELRLGRGESDARSLGEKSPRIMCLLSDAECGSTYCSTAQAPGASLW